jgi:hypothetical protein
MIVTAQPIHRDILRLLGSRRWPATSSTRSGTYRLQGEINDKHQVIVRRCWRAHRDPGDRTSSGEQVGAQVAASATSSRNREEAGNL